MVARRPVQKPRLGHGVGRGAQAADPHALALFPAQPARQPPRLVLGHVQPPAQDDGVVAGQLGQIRDGVKGDSGRTGHGCAAIADQVPRIRRLAQHTVRNAQRVKRARERNQRERRHENENEAPRPGASVVPRVPLPVQPHVNLAHRSGADGNRFAGRDQALWAAFRDWPIGNSTPPPYKCASKREYESGSKGWIP